MKNSNCLLFFFVVLLSFFSCTDKSENVIVDGYKPVYISKSILYSISSSTPLPIINPGKIYLYGAMVFINERGRGVHVINNSNPYSPLNIRFINIPGNYDIAINGNMLYADNATDLVTLDISNLDDIQIVSRIPNIYEPYKQMYPDFYNGYFECVDTSLGYVIAWEKSQLTNPKCFR
ncbi:MAG: hypothetical protein PHT69_14670 [Bacteroidales bacterium]|nr:hypothetical protein [Bacteroidales bacterium]